MIVGCGHRSSADRGNQAAQHAGEPAAEPVSQSPRRKLTKRVSQAEDKHELRQVEITVMARSSHHRHDDAEILPAEVIAGIKNPRRRENAKAPPQPPGLAGWFGFDNNRRESCRFHESIQSYRVESALSHVLNS